MGRYEFYLGPSDRTYTLWKLNNITSIDMSLSKKTTPLGVPTFPARSAMMFDMEGPVRKFVIEGIRDEQKETVSNWDFIFTKNNLIPGNVNLIGRNIKNPIYMGLEWATSFMQITYPFTFISHYVPDTYIPPSVPNKAQLDADLNLDANAYIQGEFCVSVSNLSFDFDPKTPGLLKYKVDLIERRAWK